MAAEADSSAVGSLVSMAARVDMDEAVQVIGGDEGLVGGGGDDEAGRHGQAGLCQPGQILGLAAGGGQGGEGRVEGEDGGRGHEAGLQNTTTQEFSLCSLRPLCLEQRMRRWLTVDRVQ